MGRIRARIAETPAHEAAPFFESRRMASALHGQRSTRAVLDLPVSFGLLQYRLFDLLLSVQPLSSWLWLDRALAGACRQFDGRGQHSGHSARGMAGRAHRPALDVDS